VYGGPIYSVRVRPVPDASNRTTPSVLSRAARRHVYETIVTRRNFRRITRKRKATRVYVHRFAKSVFLRAHVCLYVPVRHLRRTVATMYYYYYYYYHFYYYCVSACRSADACAPPMPTSGKRVYARARRSDWKKRTTHDRPNL